MLIFLYGRDTFRLSRKLAQIVEEYKRKTCGLEFTGFDALTADAGGFFSGLRQNSMFGAKKFFVVKNPIAAKDFKEALVPKIKEVASTEHNIVFCQEGKVMKADRLLKAFSRYAQIQEFEPLAGTRLRAWVAAEFKKNNCRINSSAVEIFAARAGNDLWRAENEIQKLVHFFAGKEITAGDIESVVVSAEQANIFAIVDAAAVRDKKNALALLKERVQKGDHPLYLLAIIASQFKNLLLVKSMGPAAGARRLGIHPYVFGKTAAQAGKFTFPDLRGIYQRICRTDLDIKSGKIDPEAGMDLLIAAL